MRINRITELGNGSFEIYLLVKEIQTKTARNGSSFLTFVFTDGTDTVAANMWDTDIKAIEVSEKQIVFAALEGKPYNGKLSYTVERIRKTFAGEDVDVSKFIPTSPVAPQTLYDFCAAKADKMTDRKLSELVKLIFAENKEKLLWQSAAKSVHHNKVGELLWHTARMAKLASSMADTYTFLDRDMIMAGVLLHDIGKLEELYTDEMGITEYTDDGYLFGHLFLGVEMIKKYAEQVGLPEERLRCLTHIIASHHGEREYGSIVLPSTAEAYAVHCIDLIDSRMYIFEDTLRKLEPESFSEPLHTMDGVRVYRPGKE